MPFSSALSGLEFVDEKGLKKTTMGDATTLSPHEHRAHISPSSFGAPKTLDIVGAYSHSCLAAPCAWLPFVEGVLLARETARAHAPHCKVLESTPILPARSASYAEVLCLIAIPLGTGARRSHTHLTPGDLFFQNRCVFHSHKPFCAVFAYAEEDQRQDDTCGDDDEEAGVLLPARRRAADADLIRARKKQTVGTETTSTVDVEVNVHDAKIL